jgi:hypothetical protein
VLGARQRRHTLRVGCRGGHQPTAAAPPRPHAAPISSICRCIATCKSPSELQPRSNGGNAWHVQCWSMRREGA